MRAASGTKSPEVAQVRSLRLPLNGVVKFASLVRAHTANPSCLEVQVGRVNMRVELVATAGYGARDQYDWSLCGESTAPGPYPTGVPRSGWGSGLPGRTDDGLRSYTEVRVIRTALAYSPAISERSTPSALPAPAGRQRTTGLQVERAPQGSFLKVAVANGGNIRPCIVQSAGLGGPASKPSPQGRLGQRKDNWGCHRLPFRPSRCRVPTGSHVGPRHRSICECQPA